MDHFITHDYSLSDPVYIEYSERGGRAVEVLADLCDIDPATSTPSIFDALDYRFHCGTCQFPGRDRDASTWRAAMAHFVVKHHPTDDAPEPEPLSTLVDPLDIMHARDSKHPVKSMLPKSYGWCCALCMTHIRGNVTYTEVLAHLNDMCVTIEFTHLVTILIFLALVIQLPLQWRIGISST